MTTPPHVPKGEDGSQPARETLLTRPGAQSESSAHQDQGQPGVQVDDRELQQSQAVALQLGMICTIKQWLESIKSSHKC